MKNLLKNFFGLMVIVSLCSLTFTACSDDDDDSPSNVDKTELNALITECETLLNNASTTDYPQAAITQFSTILTTVKEAANSSSITQQQVNNLTVQLTEAETAFLESAYGAIPADALVIGLGFDEGTDELTTTGKRQLKAVLTAGPSEVFGSDTSKPTYVDGQNGGKALHFAKGGHVEIPTYTSSDFLSNTISIAVWVKPDSVRAGNYIASLNYWNNWKFQIQEQSKPFFTVAATAGVTDADNESDNSAPNGKWTHLVMSLDLSNSKLTFYVNGTATKTWDSTSKGNLKAPMAQFYTSTAVGQLPFMIGAATTYAEASSAWDWAGWNNPKGWDYFAGAMDEFKVYNVALTDGQVSKLYNDEKAK